MKSSLLLLSLLALPLLAQAGSGARADDAINARYRSERAACMSGQSNQDRATCLKEAGAARAVARRDLSNDRSGNYQQNAMARCAALPAADKVDCQRRMQGDGKVSGSVRDGGLLRETTTVIPADPAASAPAQ